MAVIHFAPLQGYTDSVYREAHTRVFGGVDTYYTPFVRIEKGGFRNKDLKDIACDRNRQVHVVPQLIASTPDEFRSIVRLFQENGYRQAPENAPLYLGYLPAPLNLHYNIKEVYIPHKNGRDIRRVFGNQG